MSDGVVKERIPKEKTIYTGSMPEDSEFVSNRSSLRSKKIIVINHNLTIEVWFNRHYYERFYWGDDKGKRRGIEPAIVESLVARSIPHLFWYSTVFRGFNFINNKKNTGFSNRIVLQEIMNGSKLNVVVEIHFLGLDQFEVTVITAMVVDKFKISSGQFCIEIQQEYSCLKKIDNGKVLDLCSFPLVQ